MQELNQGACVTGCVISAVLFGACGTVTRGGRCFLVTWCIGSALGCMKTVWPVAGDVLFDQLSRGFFRQRRGKCAHCRLSGRTPLWRAYRSVFTCLLSQVVQTGRLPFSLSDSGQYIFFCRAGRVNGTNTGTMFTVQ